MVINNQTDYSPPVNAKWLGRNMTPYERISTMLTTGEVARLLNVHPNTVRRWSNQGVIKAYRVGPRSDRRFLRDNIAAFLAERAFQRYFRSKDT